MFFFILLQRQLQLVFNYQLLLTKHKMKKICFFFSLMAVLAACNSNVMEVHKNTEIAKNPTTQCLAFTQSLQKTLESDFISN